MQGLERIWGRIVGQGHGALVARVYKVNDPRAIVNKWQQEMSLAYTCFLESNRKGISATPNEFYLASQTCKQLLGLPLNVETSNSDVIDTPHDNDAREAFAYYMKKKNSQYFSDLMRVYGELIAAFSPNPKTVIWDLNVHERFLITLEEKDVVQMYMRLQISLDKSRSNHQYIVRSIVPELNYTLSPDNHTTPQRGLSLQIHRMAASATQKLFPTVMHIEIADPLPAMVKIFERAGIHKPYTPQQFTTYCENCGDTATRRLQKNVSIAFCKKDDCVLSYMKYESELSNNH